MENTRYTINSDIKIVYVVLRNENKFNPLTNIVDDYSTVVKVFKTQSSAEQYIECKKKTVKGNVKFFCFPTPYED